MSSENLGDFYKENKKLVSEYIDTRIELIKLGAIKTLAKTLSALILVGLISFMMLFFLLFVVIAFSWYMADQLGSAALGFLCGGGVFIAILLLSIVFRKALFLNPLIRIFLHASTEEDEESSDETED
ncbi:MAG: hypothetical protein RL634_686 [Bacteroidota bacterium]|jgi:uncharacterized membrane protein (DUF485 family)